MFGRLYLHQLGVNFKNQGEFWNLQLQSYPKLSLIFEIDLLMMEIWPSKHWLLLAHQTRETFFWVTLYNWVIVRAGASSPESRELVRWSVGTGQSRCKVAGIWFNTLRLFKRKTVILDISCFKWTQLNVLPFFLFGCCHRFISLLPALMEVI